MNLADWMKVLRIIYLIVKALIQMDPSNDPDNK